jgi:hypothetical protein
MGDRTEYGRVWAALFWLPLIVALAATAPARAGEPLPGASPAGDAARRAMLREVANQQQAREAAFARLKTLPAMVQPPPVAGVLAVGAFLEEVPPTNRPAPARDDWGDAEDGDPTVRVSERAFDFFLLGDLRNAGEVRYQLDSVLVQRIEHAARTWGLSVAEKNRLRLAGRGDMKRFLDDIERRRRDFARVRSDVREAERRLQDLRPLAQTLRAGPYGEGSLFAKVLKTMIDEKPAGAGPPAAARAGKR